MWIYKLLQSIVEKWEGDITSVTIYEGWLADFEAEATIPFSTKFPDINIISTDEKLMEIK